jgi:hypothetical protein
MQDILMRIVFENRDTRNRFHAGTFVQLISDADEDAKGQNSYVRVEAIIALELIWKETVRVFVL